MVVKKVFEVENEYNLQLLPGGLAKKMQGSISQTSCGQMPDFFSV